MSRRYYMPRTRDDTLCMSSDRLTHPLERRGTQAAAATFDNVPDDDQKGHKCPIHRRCRRPFDATSPVGAGSVEVQRSTRLNGTSPAVGSSQFQP
ncbi:hypothetical protein L596_002230 [Steinernema carpocapsae]|uniref:Uncharacterized protein n=1 Tax=Steinernema carpocapsae TaxID=34508 RepID=A0A4V6I7L9_STECR|nr:hypothetical protein L596_002230 [Steinernema carpocapsae]